MLRHVLQVSIGDHVRQAAVGGHSLVCDWRVIDNGECYRQCDPPATLATVGTSLTTSNQLIPSSTLGDVASRLPELQLCVLVSECDDKRELIESAGSLPSASGFAFLGAVCGTAIFPPHASIASDILLSYCRKSIPFACDVQIEQKPNRRGCLTDSDQSLLLKDSTLL